MTVSVCGRSSEIHGSIGKAWGRFTREGITPASSPASSPAGGLGSRSAWLRRRWSLLTERDDRHCEQQGTRPGQKQELTGQTGSHRRPPENYGVTPSLEAASNRLPCSPAGVSSTTWVAPFGGRTMKRQSPTSTHRELISNTTISPTSRPTSAASPVAHTAPRSPGSKTRPATSCPCSSHGSSRKGTKD